MGTLFNLVNRIPVPVPWQEGDNIPWDEPGFSQRMLAEHISQDHDMASRRLAKIEAQVNWIHSEVLRECNAHVLDLCCGPGLYTSRLAALGHECVGIDFSPAAIAYAKEQAQAKNLTCRYLHEDVRRVEFGDGFGLVMMVFGQINVFRRSEAGSILEKARQALTKDGTLLLEAHPLDAVERMGASGASWCSAENGLFSPQPHLFLQESFWDAEMKTATTRFFIIDAASGCLRQHAMTTQGYSDDDYQSLLGEAGFADVQYFPSLIGKEDPTQNDLFVLKASKKSTHAHSMECVQ